MAPVKARLAAGMAGRDSDKEGLLLAELQEGLGEALENLLHSVHFADATCRARTGPGHDARVLYHPYGVRPGGYQNCSREQPESRVPQSSLRPGCS